MTITFTSWRSGCALALCLWTLGAHGASVAEYVDQAKQAQQKGDHRAAIIDLKNALQKDGKQPQVRLLLGESYVKMGDGAAAEQELKRARQLGADAAQVLPLLGQAYLQQRKFNEVVSELAPPKDTPPSLKATLLALIGAAHLGLGDKAAAREDIATAVELDPDSEQPLLAQAQMTLLQKDLDKADKQTRDLVQRFPNSVQAWLLRGELDQLRNEPAAGAEDFGRALALEPENLAGLLGEAMMFIAEKRYDDAGKDLDKVVRLSPRNPVAVYLRGLTAFQQGKFPEAEESLQKVLAVAPGYAAAHLLMGAIQYNKGELEQAAEHLKQYVSSTPGQVPARKLYAATLLKLKQPDRALETLDVVAKDNPNDPQLLSLMGSAYMQKRDFAKGTEYLEKAVATAPNAAALRTQLALGYIAAGESDQAVAQLEDAVDLGGVGQADILLVLTHLQRHEYDKALAAARTIATKMPKNPVPHNLMAAAYLGKKNRAAARKEFQQALKIDPAFAPAHANLAKLDELDGDQASAKRHYQLILDKDDKNVVAMVGLARLADAAGNAQETLDWLQRARSKAPDALEPSLFLARYDLSHDEPLKALSISQELSSRYPDNPLVLEIAGGAQLASKQNSNAIASFRRLADVQPKDPNAWYLLASAQAQDKAFKAAEESVGKALALKPDLADGLVLLAALKSEQGQLQEGIDAARRLQKLQPKAAQGFEVEGDLYADAGKMDAAAKAFREAWQRGASATLAGKLYRVRKSLGRDDALQPLEEWAKRNPGDSNVGLALASAYLNDNLNKQAIAQYQKVVKKLPENAIALNNLAMLYQMEGDPRAVETAQRAYKLKPEEPAIVDTLGWVLLQRGSDDGRAVTLLQEAAMRAPYLGEVRYHLAVGLDKLGRKDEARKELERLLRDNKDFAEAGDAHALLQRLQAK